MVETPYNTRMCDKERSVYNKEKRWLLPDNFSNDLLREWGLDVTTVHSASSQAEAGLRFCSPAASEYLAELRQNLIDGIETGVKAAQLAVENKVIANRGPTREFIRKTVWMEKEREKLGLKGEGFSHQEGTELLWRIHPSGKRRKKQKEEGKRQKRKKAWKKAD